MVLTKLVFSDTNKLFGMYRAITLGSRLEHSSLLRICKEEHIQIILSDFVIEELQGICIRESVDRDDVYIGLLFELTGFQLFANNPRDEIYTNFVVDIDDAQIVQDAVESGAEYILTNNTSDFNIKKIYDTYHILVINDVLQACLD